MDAIALLLVRCKRTSLRLLRRLPPLLTLRERSRPPLLCRRPLLYTHSVSAAIGATFRGQTYDSLVGHVQTTVHQHFLLQKCTQAPCVPQ